MNSISKIKTRHSTPISIITKEIKQLPFCPLQLWSPVRSQHRSKYISCQQTANTCTLFHQTTGNYPWHTTKTWTKQVNSQQLGSQYTCTSLCRTQTWCLHVKQQLTLNYTMLQHIGISKKSWATCEYNCTNIYSLCAVSKRTAGTHYHTEQSTTGARTVT